MDRKIERPQYGELTNIYVPTTESMGLVEKTIVRGSGIVGFIPDERAEQMIVYFEGNLYDAEALRQFNDRAKQAYGRMATKYPTVAKSVMPLAMFESVGYTDGSNVVINNQEAVDRWCFSKKEPKRKPSPGA